MPQAAEGAGLHCQWQERGSGGGSLVAVSAELPQISLALSVMQGGKQ